MQGPVVATWLDGEFRALVGDRCLDASYQKVYRYVVRLTVVSGIVTESHIEQNEEFMCEGAVVPDPAR